MWHHDLLSKQQMELHFFVVISVHMIQVPQIRTQPRTLLWRIYFPHYQASKLNRKSKVKKLFLTCCQTNPINFHCPIYRTTAIGKSHILEEHTAGKELSLRWLLGLNRPSTEEVPEQPLGLPLGNPSLSSCRGLDNKCTPQHFRTKLSYTGMQTQRELGNPPMNHLRSL